MFGSFGETSNAIAAGASLPTLAFASAVAQAEGNSGTTVFTFTLNLTRNGSTAVIPYTWTVTGNGSNPADATDFVGGVLPSGSGSFSAGETSKTIVVNVAGDTTLEPDEGFTVSATATLPLTGASALGTILNDDVAPTPTVTISAAQSINEGNSGATLFTYTVTRSTAIGAVVVPWSFTAGTTDATDYTGGVLPAGGNVSMADGVATGTIVISVNGDTTVEPNETFTVLISTPAGYVAGAATSATGTILNDDVGGAVAPGYLSTAQTSYLPIGAQRIVPSYSGPLYTLRRASDSATQTFSATGDYVDPAVAKAWIGGSQAFVTELYVQNASGMKFIQPTAANQPTVNFDELTGGAAPIIFDGGVTGIEKSMYLAGLTVDALNWSAFMTIMPDSTITNSQFMEFQAADGTGDLGILYATQNYNLLFSANAAGVTKSTGAATGALRVGFSTIGTAAAANSQIRMYTNGAVSTQASTGGTAGNMPRLKIGAGNLGSSWYGAFRLLGAAYYTTALSVADALSVRDSLDVAFAVPTAFDYRLVLGNDSIQFGTGATFLRNQPSLLQRNLTQRAAVYNTGIYGSLLSGSYSNRATYIAPTYVSTMPWIYFIEGGTNDINAGTTGANLYANTTTPLIAYLKGLGANVKVVVCTLLPRANFISTPALETERQAYNSAVVGNAAGADFVLDLASNPVMGPTGAVSSVATTYYIDGTHPNSAGYAYLAGAPSGTYANQYTYYYALQQVLRAATGNAGYVP